MLTSIVAHPSKPGGFPKLMRLCATGVEADVNHIVLFTDFRSGVSLTNTRYGKIGQYSDRLVPECFEPFYGTLTLGDRS